MSIARSARPAPPPNRPVRPLLALPAAVLALGALLSAVSVDAPAARAADPSPTPAPTWPSTVTTLGTSVKFYGRGYGHGVGLNQHGARGRALAGQTAEEILAAYYAGTTLDATDPARAVRVLVLSGFPATATSPLTIYGRGGDWTLDGVDAVFPADARLRVWRTTTTVDGVTTTTWRLKVRAPDGVTELYAGTVTASFHVRPATPDTRLQLTSRTSSYDTYRGRLRIILKPTSVNVVNRLGLDDYLRGVVPCEMPASWPAEALRAQAIAARSYAVRRLHPDTGTFDVYDDTRSQVYRGVEAERAATNAAIDAAPGAILRYGSSVVNAFFHSTGGGATENNEYAFVPTSGAVTSGPIPYLRGIRDVAPDGTPYDAGATYYAWTTSTLTRAQLSAMFKTDPRTNVGDLTRLDLRRRGASGRLYRVTLYGSAGSKTVSANVFRSVYNAKRPSGTLPLRSNLFSTSRLPAP
jgi:stage II sporulation protein D